MVQQGTPHLLTYISNCKTATDTGRENVALTVNKSISFTNFGFLNSFTIPYSGQAFRGLNETGEVAHQDDWNSQSSTSFCLLSTGI